MAIAEIKWKLVKDTCFFDTTTCYLSENGNHLFYVGKEKQIEILIDSLNELVRKGCAMWLKLGEYEFALDKLSKCPTQTWYSIHQKLYSLEPWGVIKESKKHTTKSIKEAKTVTCISCEKNLNDYRNDPMCTQTWDYADGDSKWYQKSIHECIEDAKKFMKKGYLCYIDGELFDEPDVFDDKSYFKMEIKPKSSARKSIKESLNFKKDYEVEVSGGDYWFKPFYWDFDEFRDDLLIASEESGFTYHITTASTTDYRINIEFNNGPSIRYDITFRIIPKSNKETLKELNDYLN